MAEGGVPVKETHYEVLMNIADENLKKIADRYKREYGIPYASLALTTGKNIRMIHHFSMLRFMSVGMRWKDDGTFFVLMELHHRYELAIFSLDLSGKNIYEGLVKTKRIHYGRPLIIRAIHRSLYHTIRRVLAERNLTVVSDVSQCVYILPMEDAYRYEINCPQEFELRQLEESHADQINLYWTKKFPHSRTYLALIISLSGGWGLFRKNDSRLVSWAIRMPLGDIGIVQTLQPYQRCGYGALVLMRIAKSIVADDESPIAFVPTSNEPAQLFFEKMGFNSEGTENTIELEKVDLGESSSYSYEESGSEVESLFQYHLPDSAL